MTDTGQQTWEQLHSKKVIDLYLSGLSIVIIAQMYRCSKLRISKVLHSSNIVLRGSFEVPYVPTPNDIEEATAEIRNSWSEAVEARRRVIGQKAVEVLRVSPL